MKTITHQGYLKSSEKLYLMTLELVKQAVKIPGIKSEMVPNMNLLGLSTSVDGRSVSEEMSKKGWKGMEATKEAIRCIILPYMETRIPNFVKDLKEVMEALGKEK